MRIVGPLLHLLVGLLAVALVAGAVIWAWPDGERPVRLAAWMIAGMLLATTALRMLRGRQA